MPAAFTGGPASVAGTEEGPRRGLLGTWPKVANAAPPSPRAPESSGFQSCSLGIPRPAGSRWHCVTSLGQSVRWLRVFQKTQQPLGTALQGAGGRACTGPSRLSCSRSLLPAVLPGEQLVPRHARRPLPVRVPVRPAALLAVRVPRHTGAGEPRRGGVTPSRGPAASAGRPGGT